MKYRMTVNEMMSQIKKEEINTWFDLGLYIDKFKEEKPIPTAEYNASFDELKKDIKNGGIAFLTFYYSIDGVTLEVDKYQKIFKKQLGNIPVHYIAGKFYPNADKIVDPSIKRCEIKEMKGFDDWSLYEDFFFTKLERGSKEYNALIIKFWKQVVTIVRKLGTYIENNNIKLLYILNVNSNTGNVASALANVLVSEYLGIPVINNNHDFYWEGGNKPIDIKENGKTPGPRDFFFKNSDVGEFFSLIEVLFPWDSRSWINVNINKGQTNKIIEEGHNPANIEEIGTAVDLDLYINNNKRDKINAFVQFEKVFSRYENTLIGYSIDDVINNNLVDKNDPKPILIGNKTRSLTRFLSENIVFLQPTRIISRKNIEVGFKLIYNLLKDDKFVNKFRESKDLKLTFLVTGPIPMGQYAYFKELINKYYDLLKSINEDFVNRIFLGFLFSEIDKENFKKKFKNPIGIPELYNIASLILLPSETEGRGLPIIEAAATGVPIFCRRYYPEKVYAQVIGEHLPEEDRLKVIEFDGKKITKDHIKSITQRVFFPHKFIDEVDHNRRVVKKRYSLESLSENIEKIIYKLYLQLHSNNMSMETAKASLQRYKKINNFKNDDLKEILNTDKRQYVAGFGKLAYMQYLKSLIDPSYFRVEEKNIKGLAFSFACGLIESDHSKDEFPLEKVSEFYNAVDNIFNYTDGEVEIRHDHSFSYRHRNKNYYPYQEFTIQEITGLINMLYQEIIKPEFTHTIEQGSHFFTDWNLALSQLTSSDKIAIDDRDKLVYKLKSNLPIAYFPGKFVKYELEFFALQSVRARLKLPLDVELTEDHIKDKFKDIAPIYIFAQEKPLGKWMTADEIINYILKGNDKELKLLYDYHILRIIKTHQLCVGIHFQQLGELAINILKEVKEMNGFIISNRRNAVLMTDIVDIDRFHIGLVTYQVTSNFMGIPLKSGYIQFVPAGVRTTIAYPTPIQTSKDFHDALKSDLYKDLCKLHGEEKVLEIIKKDASESGSPIVQVLNRIKNKDTSNDIVDYNYVNGIYKDGNPWNGVMAKVSVNSGMKLGYEIVSSVDKTKRVTSFVEEFEKSHKKKAKIAWNGGYILNPELVGKLGLPESYIGSPLGLLISNKKLISTPLFNKPALIIYDDDSIDIKKVRSDNGISITKDITIEFSKESYNNEISNKPCYYDLMHKDDYVNGDGRIIVRLAGNTIKEIIHTHKKEIVNIIPVGLILSFPADKFPENWKVEDELEIKINGLENIKHAVEAGPMLVNNEETCIDMELEGWKTENSIRTQAARLDYIDMRGPKIAVGIDKQGNMYVLTINGRIRESVGATHVDMADIMMSFGMEKAMGFDPGGSSTLVVNGKTLNISPYNHEYEKNVYALAPEPRAVANAVIGFIQEEEENSDINGNKLKDIMKV